MIYVLGFFIPYVYNSLALNAIQNIQDETNYHFIFRCILYSLQAATQIYFLRLEIPEIYYQNLEYFKEIYNVFDISQPILFTIHLILRIIYGKLEDFEWMRLADNLVEIFIITGATIKLLSYIRFKEEYSYFV